MEHETRKYTTAKLKETRIGRGVPTTALAELLEIAVSQYYKRENMELRFQVNECYKLAEFFGTSIDELFFE